MHAGLTLKAAGESVLAQGFETSYDARVARRTGYEMSQTRLEWHGRWPLYAIGGNLLLLFFFPARVWVATLLVFAGVLALAYVWARSLIQGVVWHRQVRQAIMVAGDRVIESFEIENASPFPLLWAEIRDHSDVPGYTASRVEAVDGRGHKRWETQGTCERRGVFHLGPWEAVTGDPFGIFRVHWTFPVERTVLVYPRIVRLPPITLPRGHMHGQAREWRASLVEDVAAAGVRPYLPGDPLRRIHWPTSARRGNLFSRLFDMEPSGDLWLVLDLDAEVQAGEGTQSTEEYAVVLAASLAAKMLAQGRAVGLACSGEHATLVPPRAGTGHLWELLGHLARARSAPTTPLSDFLDQVMSTAARGCTLVIFTPSTATDWVSRLVAAHARELAASVIWLDPGTFVPPGRPDPHGPVLRALLARHAIPAHTITADFPFEIALKIRRKRTEYRILPGTGRVIQVEVEEEV